MDERDLKKQLLQLAKKMGATALCIELQRKGLSPSTAERLSLGTHEGTFKRRTVTAVQAVLSEIKAS